MEVKRLYYEFTPTFEIGFNSSKNKVPLKIRWTDKKRLAFHPTGSIVLQLDHESFKPTTNAKATVKSE